MTKTRKSEASRNSHHSQKYFSLVANLYTYQLPLVIGDNILSAKVALSLENGQ